MSLLLSKGNEMDRFRKRSFFAGMSPGRAVGFLVLMGFVLFIAFRIFSAPEKVILSVTAPDGSQEARLLHVFYYSEPGYRVSVRKRYFWHTLYYLADYPDVPLSEREETLRWSRDSEQLTFEVNGKKLWSYDFPTQSSRWK